MFRKQFPEDILKHIFKFHSNVRFDKKELLEWIEVKQKYSQCIRCELSGNLVELDTILDNLKMLQVEFVPVYSKPVTNEKINNSLCAKVI